MIMIQRMQMEIKMKGGKMLGWKNLYQSKWTLQKMEAFKQILTTLTTTITILEDNLLC